MSTKVVMKADAKAVLFVRGYRYLCPKCKTLNVEDMPVHKAICSQCHTVFTVKYVFLINGTTPVAGIPQSALEIAPFFEMDVERRLENRSIPGFSKVESAGEIDLEAIGYLWACPECDPWGKQPHLESKLVTSVTCHRCSATYLVIQFSHKLDTHTGAKTLLGHAVEFVKEPNDEPGGQDKGKQNTGDDGEGTSDALSSWSFL